MANIPFEKLRESQRKKYSTKNPLKRRAIRNLLNRILKLIPTHIETMMEAGCGEGVACNHINRNREIPRFLGIDLDPTALKVAKTWNPNVDFVLANISALPLKNRSIELSLCLEVIEHLDKPRTALDELKRVTRDSIILSAPDSTLFRLANIASLKNLRNLGEDPEHIQRYTEDSFRELLEERFQESKIYVEKSFPWLIARISSN
jgi:ubiquinone/menaquinone biosynthesis C-methylase UbiE